MRPALRTRLCDVVDTTGQIYSELLRSLAISHKADYLLSIDIENRNVGDWMTNYAGRVSIQKHSYQHRCCGQRAFKIISDSEYSEMEFDWTVADDLEMLQQRACSKQVMFNSPAALFNV
eukprot:scaffold6586_cov169-Ochromonas_danica.AAC.1